MILKNYLFSKISGVYQQYPNDVAGKFLQKACDDAVANYQISICRDGDRMYYAYIYRNSNQEIYGQCFVCGEICTNIKWLQTTFKESIEQSAHKGALFRYDGDGQIVKCITNFASEDAEVDSFFNDLNRSLIEDNWKPLGPINFTVSKESKIILSFAENDNEKMVECIELYHSVIISLENPIPSSYSNTIKSLNQENKSLNKRIEDLSKDNDKLHRKKKQYGWVSFLSIIAIIGLIISVYLSQVISDKGNTIKKLETDISELNFQIASIKDTLSHERLVIKNQNIKINSLQSENNSYSDIIGSVKNSFPIIITNIEIGNVYKDGTIETEYGNRMYSSNTMFLVPKVYYMGIYSECNIELKIKWFYPNGTLSVGTDPHAGYSQKESIYVYSGDQSTTLRGWGNTDKGYWGKGNYRIEIWHNDICLKSKTFTIY